MRIATVFAGLVGFEPGEGLDGRTVRTVEVGMVLVHVAFGMRCQKRGSLESRRVQNGQGYRLIQARKE